jgi:hypothetical protein
MAVETHPANSLCEPTSERSTEPGKAPILVFEFVRRDLDCQAEAYDQRDVEGAWTKGALLAAAKRDRQKTSSRRTGANIKSANAFGPVSLVSGKTRKMDVFPKDVDSSVSNDLREI